MENEDDTEANYGNAYKFLKDIFLKNGLKKKVFFILKSLLKTFKKIIFFLNFLFINISIFLSSNL